MTPAQLQAATLFTLSNASRWCASITAAMAEYSIDTPTRQAAFLAQISHESARLVYSREIWGPTPAQARYEGRADLGNTQPGDGKRYLGRGLIQITGRDNYAKCGAALGIDLIKTPELLEQAIPAARSAGWYWSTHGCNALADAGDFVGVTRKINGGTNGLADRQAIYAAARAALGA